MHRDHSIIALSGSQARVSTFPARALRKSSRAARLTDAKDYDVRTFDSLNRKLDLRLVYGLLRLVEQQTLVGYLTAKHSSEDI
jgi:hypothetical protein